MLKTRIDRSVSDGYPYLILIIPCSRLLLFSAKHGILKITIMETLIKVPQADVS